VGPMRTHAGEAKVSGFQRRRTRTAKGEPGRKGSGWNDCRKVVLFYSKVCAICRRPLYPKARMGTPLATEVDHYPVPLFRMKQAYDNGEITWEEFERRANDPNGCRAVHRQCHQDPELAPGPPPRPPRPNEDGTVTGPTSREW
jgi:hypothetical protein